MTARADTTKVREALRNLLDAYYAGLVTGDICKRAEVALDSAAQEGAGPVAIQPLVWTQPNDSCWYGDAPMHKYSVSRGLAQPTKFYAAGPLLSDFKHAYFGTLDEAKAACESHWQAYVRSLLAPVDEANDPEMCPNCVTPWKCNGPHEFPAATSEAPVAWMRKRGAFVTFARHREYEDEIPLYEHPAPLPADAGVTEAMVETFEAKFLECARTRPDSTLRDDIRAALVAALGARKGK